MLLAVSHSLFQRSIPPRVLLLLLLLLPVLFLQHASCVAAPQSRTVDPRSSSIPPAPSPPSSSPSSSWWGEMNDCSDETTTTFQDLIRPIRAAHEAYVAAQERRYAAWDAPPDPNDVPQEREDPFESALMEAKRGETNDANDKHRDDEAFFQERVGGGRLSQEAALLRYAAEQREAETAAIERWLQRLQKAKRGKQEEHFWTTHHDIQRNDLEREQRRLLLAEAQQARSSLLLWPMHWLCAKAEVQWPCRLVSWVYRWWLWDVVAVVLLVVIPWRMLLELQRVQQPPSRPLRTRR